MNDQQQIVELLREQNQLLKRYLWRLRFSLLGLLLLTTGIAITLGTFVYVYQKRSRLIFPAPTASVYSAPPAIATVTEERILPDGKVVLETRAIETYPAPQLEQEETEFTESVPQEPPSPTK